MEALAARMEALPAQRGELALGGEGPAVGDGDGDAHLGAVAAMAAPSGPEGAAPLVCELTQIAIANGWVRSPFVREWTQIAITNGWIRSGEVPSMISRA